jgi:uncharacterized protein YecE (DUF72 family)
VIGKQPRAGRRARILVSTSGWNYRDWCGRFYPETVPASRWFGHYARVFNTVEINNTFYRLPAAATFDAWNQQAPPEFIYAVKANHFLTHIKKLKNAGKPLALFLRRARRLKPHLGPILYQLPPRWKPDLERLKKFCARLPPGLTHVIEFRERAWLKDETYRVLAKRGISLCLHDLLKRHPRRITGPAVYVRFHGADSKYGGSYSRERLRHWAAWLREAAKDGHDVYAYFNNDRNAAAVRNAQTLRRILSNDAVGQASRLSLTSEKASD